MDAINGQADGHLVGIMFALAEFKHGDELETSPPQISLQPAIGRTWLEKRHQQILDWELGNLLSTGVCL